MPMRMPIIASIAMVVIRLMTMSLAVSIQIKDEGLVEDTVISNYMILSGTTFSNLFRSAKDHLLAAIVRLLPTYLKKTKFKMGN